MAEDKKATETAKKEEKKADLSKNVEKILEDVKKLTVMELSELVKAFEDEFDVKNIQYNDSKNQVVLKGKERSLFVEPYDAYSDNKS